MRVFCDMRVPNGMPRIEFGNNVKPFKYYEDDSKAANICHEMLGDYYSDWIRQFEAPKCVKKLFTFMFEHNR